MIIANTARIESEEKSWQTEYPYSYKPVPNSAKRCAVFAARALFQSISTALESILRHSSARGRKLTSTISKAGRNTPISVTVEGETGEHLAFVREVQRDPLRGSILHVDFLRTEATQRVSAEVPVVITGDSPGARETGGTVVQQLYAVTVEALPLDMPRDISVDLVALTQEEPVIRVGDITLPATVTMLNEANDVVARIQAARVVEVEVVEGAPEAEEAEAAESQQEA